MRLCQISRQKSAYLRDLSTAITEQRINLENLRQLPEPEIRLQLKTIKGIGNWTTDIYMMFCLQAKDVFPFGDIAIINTMKELTSEITQEQIIARALLWKPYRSLAAYFLWHYYLRKRNR
jgi:DNA-3-methyladenine glycosylase II